MIDHVNIRLLSSVFFVLTLITLVGTTPFQIASAENMEQNISLKKQMMAGIDVYEIQCNDGYNLVLKITDWSPACCKSSSVDQLIQRGWAADHDIMHSH